MKRRLTIDEMDFLTALAPVAAILSIGIFVQSAAGFAAGLLIVPSMLWIGYQIPEASTALLVATIPQNILGVWSLRDCIEPKSIAWPGVARVLALPIGVYVLKLIEQNYPVVGIRQFVGGVVLLATLSIIFIRPKPRPTIHPIWAWLTFPLSGFLQGLVGMGGPVMVFWVQAHDWSSRRTRGFLFGMYLVSMIPALAVLWYVFGHRIVQPALLSACSLPCLILATQLGLRLGNWLGRDRLRRVTLALLLLMGISGLATPWIQPRRSEAETAPETESAPLSPPFQ
ncbi:sulfite exporter TauE/SafE family protein [Stieleria varia]|uniref:Probable membrane transporter protein n=1 Tax=Stieleria varia TaxID=2528005 RepID=A0A5C6A1Q2_9BACT|nr:sulfite exporter TauE/SafE family protein [Stieleria varia]TWT93784.1 Sulfite exporter TauE/SafE [Stieleria varia]